MPDEIEKPNPDDVLKAITSFNDPSIIVNIFKELGWTYSFEIKEWLMMARQNANLAVKSKALIQLRKLLREAAETSGYIANVSTTAPNAAGGQTTFSAKRISGILNPTKKIESTIKENQDDEKEIRPEPNRGSDRGESQAEKLHNESSNTEPDSRTPGTDTRRAFPLGDAESGGTEPADGGATPRPVPGGGNPPDGNRKREPCGHQDNSDAGDSPCIKTRPPTCDQDLFPGISSGDD